MNDCDKALQYLEYLAKIGVKQTNIADDIDNAIKTIRNGLSSKSRKTKYTYYLYDGNKCIDSGTSGELEKRYNLTQRIHHYYKNKHRVHRKYRVERKENE